MKKKRTWEEHQAKYPHLITPEYRVWVNMKQRCYNKKHPFFKYYGARGIHVCTRWRDSFANFLQDIGLRPTKDHTIERKDNNGHYAPDNCCWATRTEQARNERHFSREYTIDGETRTLAEWCKTSKVRYNTIHSRLKNGWTLKFALVEPTKRHKKHVKRY